MTMPNRWSADEVARFLQLRADGMPNSEIAERLGRSMTSLHRKLRYLPDAPRRSGQFEPAAQPKRVKRAGKVTLPPLASTQT
jgi:predicted transcriptional regulator